MESTEYRDAGQGTKARRAERLVTGYFDKAGITVNGALPWDPTIKDPRLFERVLNQGSLGLGESYMDEWWDCGDLSEFFRRLITWRTENGGSLRLSNSTAKT